MHVCNVICGVAWIEILQFAKTSSFGVVSLAEGVTKLNDAPANKASNRCKPTVGGREPLY